jgi:hypothetical protein
MFIILKTEEDCAQFMRDCDPDLPDNQVTDELSRLECLETGKMIVCDPQMTRMMIRDIRKMSASEKQALRENMRWATYKLRSDTVN